MDDQDENSLCGDEALFYSTEKNWYNEFDRDRTWSFDKFREGRPKSVVLTKTHWCCEIFGH